MENQNQLDNIFKITFDDNGLEQLQTITLWARICAICAFAGYALALIVAFFGRNPASQFEGSSTAVSFGRASLIAGALVSAIIGTAINYFLYRFAVDAKQGLSNIDQVKLNQGLISLKTYFKILGIILLICLIFLGLAILVGGLAAIGRR
jgi:small-conductance mechanosensitive channel